MYGPKNCVAHFGIVYNNTYYEPKTVSDIGLMNKNNTGNICIPDKSLSFANPLILNNYN